MGETKKKGLKALANSVAVWNYIESAILVVAGILFLIFCNNETLHDIFLILIGAVLILDGGVRIIKDLLKLFQSHGKSDLSLAEMIPGAIEIAIGVAFVTAEIAALLNFFINLIAVLLIVAGALLIILGIYFLATNAYEKNVTIPEILIGIVMLVLGILAYIFISSDTAILLILIILGIALLLSGIVLFYITYHGMKSIGKIAKAHEEMAKAAEEAAPDVVVAEETVVIEDDKPEE